MLLCAHRQKYTQKTNHAHPCTHFAHLPTLMQSHTQTRIALQDTPWLAHRHTLTPKPQKPFTRTQANTFKHKHHLVGLQAVPLVPVTGLMVQVT